jgi:hypothetical protein
MAESVVDSRLEAEFGRSGSRDAWFRAKSFLMTTQASVAGKALPDLREILLVHSQQEVNTDRGFDLLFASESAKHELYG